MTRQLHHPSRSLRASAVSLAVVALAPLLLTVAVNETASAGPVYQVVNTGGIGVRLRNSPSFNDIKGPGPQERASFELLCQILGDPVGRYSNRVWDQIRWNGQVGYIPDTYASTPTRANEFVPGVPRCGTPAATPALTPAPATAPAPAATPNGNTLQSGQTLFAGQNLKSSDGRFLLAMQGDGNLVLYAPGSRVLWASNTAGRAGARVVMQGDGNLVIYDNANGARWASNTDGRGPVRLVVQDDGNTVLYTNSTAVWATNTSVPAPAPAPAPGQTTGDRIANFAAQYVGQWGGNACRDAGWSGYTGGLPGVNGAPSREGDGQCRAFANCVVKKVTGINPVVGGGSYALAGASQVSPQNAGKGDIIQRVGRLHTAIVLENRGQVAPNKWSFTVVDPNFDPNYNGTTNFGDEIVRQHEWTVEINTSVTIWRYA